MSNRTATEDFFTNIPVTIDVSRKPLANLTTLGVGGQAEVWALQDPSTVVRDLNLATSQPYRILGAGSNILASDEGVNERVIKFSSAFNDIKKFTEVMEQAAKDEQIARGEQVAVWLGAATPMPGLVRRSQRYGMSGLEGLLGVPAVLGGAIAMNAGTRYGDMLAVVQTLEIFLAGELVRITASDVGFSYRHTNLPKGAIVTAAELLLTKQTPEAVAEKMAEVDAARKSQPKRKSAGCAFKNPIGDSAGRLIDQAGLKGMQSGQAVVAHEHANFIVNLGQATASDVKKLIEILQSRVHAEHGIWLEPEWKLWGFNNDALRNKKSFEFEDSAKKNISPNSEKESIAESLLHGGASKKDLQR